MSRLGDDEINLGRNGGRLLSEPTSLSHFPRVLIVHMARIKKSDQHGLLIRNLFANWPHESLAQIYSGAEKSGEDFTALTFKLGSKERRFGKIFFALKNPTLKTIQPFHIKKEMNSGETLQVSQMDVLKSKLGHLIIDSGFWELPFPPQLSDNLTNWIQAFMPEVIYCQGYSLGYCWLSMMIHSRFNIPLVFHTSDDWPNQLYRRRPYMHSLVLRTTKRLLEQASVRLAFSARMAEGYNQQFGIPFDDVIMHSDKPARFQLAQPKRIADERTILIVYTGSMGHGRWQSLLDLAQAAEKLKQENINIEVVAYLLGVPIEAVKVLQQQTNLKLLPPLDHNEVPAILKGSDILFLPETFEPKMAHDIRYSISTKAHLYMMSKRPILVYGSPEAGVVDYALRDGWALVVQERNSGKLVEALRELVTNKSLCKRLILAATNVIQRNHDAAEVLKRFEKIMQLAADSSKGQKESLSNPIE